MLKKLFGRNKQQQHQEKKTRNKDSQSQACVGTPISGTEQETPSSEVKQVELATFSAQFPPPEWQWYESQHRQEQFPASSHPPHKGRQRWLLATYNVFKSNNKLWLGKFDFTGHYRLLRRHERGIIHKFGVKAGKF